MKNTMRIFTGYLTKKFLEEMYFYFIKRQVFNDDKWLKQYDNRSLFFSKKKIYKYNIYFFIIHKIYNK